MLIYIKDYDDDSTSSKADHDQPFLINSNQLESVNVVYYRDTARYALRLTTNSYEIPLRPFMCGQDIVSTKESHDRAMQAINDIMKLISGVGCSSDCVITISDNGVSWMPVSMLH
jgi:DNA-directed RNA polymerase subunit N (RpoN/RPB10)